MKHEKTKIKRFLRDPNPPVSLNRGQNTGSKVGNEVSDCS